MRLMCFLHLLGTHHCKSWTEIIILCCTAFKTRAKVKNRGDEFSNQKKKKKIKKVMEVIAGKVNYVTDCGSQMVTDPNVHLSNSCVIFATAKS